MDKSTRNVVELAEAAHDAYSASLKKVGVRDVKKWKNLAPNTKDAWKAAVTEVMKLTLEQMKHCSIHRAFEKECPGCIDAVQK